MAVWKISDEKVRARDWNARRLKAVGAGKFECQRAPIHTLKLTPTDWAVQPCLKPFRNPGRRSVGMRIRAMVVRPPERRQVPAEVQFEVTRNAVAQTADPGT